MPPFFKILQEAQTWGDRIEDYLHKPPILTSPRTCETIGIYSATSEVAVSSVLFVDSSENLIYFLSYKFIGGESNYTRLEEIA